MTADFRSDTLTAPTREMRAAMSEAKVGDDVYGEDPTVRRLEEEAAEMLGVESSLFVPSGTMANQCAIQVHCRAGDEVICDAQAHVHLYEGGGIARWSGATVRGIPTSDGFPEPAAIAAAVQPDDVHLGRSRLLALENTNNRAGGTVLDPAGLAARVDVARRHGLQVHVDGARIVNAAVALDLPAAELTTGVDSVTLCLSKGLGAPVGSVVGGSRDFVHEARRARKAFGGGMRQAGILAAAGLIALRDARATVAADHARAARLAEGLQGLAGISVAAPLTNIVMLDLVAPRAAELVEHLASRAVKASLVRSDRIRFVTHRDLGDDAVDRCIEAVISWTSAPSSFGTT